MSGAFEQAWSLLKSFQVADADEVVGQGRNQLVLGQKGSPDVTKVGGVMGAGDMYRLNRLAAMMPQRFVSQQPLLETMPLTGDIQGSFKHTLPIVSTQERGDPLRGEAGRNPNLSEEEAEYIDSVKGRELARAMYGIPGGALLEGLGLSDIKEPNWMRTRDQKGFPVADLTNVPTDIGRAKIMDPQFAGPTNLQENPLDTGFQLRGTPRKFGEQYSIPAADREEFARRIDALPFDKFVDPIYQSYEDLYPESANELYERLSAQEHLLNEELGHIGVQ